MTTVETLTIPGADGHAGLANLGREAGFSALCDAVATTIADRFQFQIHYHIVAMRAAYADWIERQRCLGDTAGHDGLVATLANLIGAIASHRMVGFTTMLRDPSETAHTLALFKKYPNEIVGLMLGAALYGDVSERVAGHDPVGPVAARRFAEAAETLRRRPEAAADFRRLLGLDLPTH